MGIIRVRASRRAKSYTRNAYSKSGRHTGIEKVYYPATGRSRARIDAVQFKVADHMVGAQFSKKRGRFSQKRNAQLRNLYLKLGSMKMKSR